MRKKFSHEQLEQRVKALEKQVYRLKGAEKALRSSEQRFRDLYKNAPIAYFSVSPDDGTILRVNAEATRLLGRKKKDLEQMKVFDLYADTPHGIHRAKALFQRFQTGESIRDEELQMKRDGKPLWINLHVEPVQDPDGEVVESRSMVIDISKRKMAEEALSKSEKRYRLLVETMNEGLGVLDKKACLKYFNHKFCEMLGYQKDEIVGRPIVDFLPEPDQSIFKTQFTMRKNGKSTRYEMKFASKEGREIPTIISGTPIFDGGKRFKGSFAVITDISDRKKMETELATRAADLEELNTALKVLLKRREQDKAELEEKIIINVKELVMPYLEKLKRSRLNERQRTYLTILESNLNEIISPFARSLSFNLWNLTHKEMEIANLIKYGKTTKEIAEMLNLSTRTIESHRKNVRQKLGIKNNKSNLRTYLSSL
jgi:PAS domain S-box-containing protein